MAEADRISRGTSMFSPLNAPKRPANAVLLKMRAAAKVGLIRLEADNASNTTGLMTISELDGEVLTKLERRRRWTVEQKLVLMATARAVLLLLRRAARGSRRDESKKST